MFNFFPLYPHSWNHLHFIFSVSVPLSLYQSFVRVNSLKQKLGSEAAQRQTGAYSLNVKPLISPEEHVCNLKMTRGNTKQKKQDKPMFKHTRYDLNISSENNQRHPLLRT